MRPYLVKVSIETGFEPVLNWFQSTALTTQLQLPHICIYHIEFMNTENSVRYIQFDRFNIFSIHSIYRIHKRRKSCIKTVDIYILCWISLELSRIKYIKTKNNSII